MSLINEAAKSYFFEIEILVYAAQGEDVKYPGTYQPFHFMLISICVLTLHLRQNPPFTSKPTTGDRNI